MQPVCTPSVSAQMQRLAADIGKNMLQSQPDRRLDRSLEQHTPALAGPAYAVVNHDNVAQ